MIKQFLKDSVVYGAGRILTYGISFFLIPLYAHIFDPDDYGAINLMTVFYRLAMLVVALEITQGVMRFIADTKSREERTAYTSTGFWFSILMYTLFVIIAWMLPASISKSLLEVDGHQTIFRVGVLMIWARGLFTFALEQLRFEFKSRQFVLVSVTNTLLSLLLIILLVVVLRAGVPGVFLGQFLAALIAMGLAVYFARGSYRFMMDGKKLRAMLHFSSPLVFSGLGVFVNLYVDQILIKGFLTVGDVGIYGVGYQLASIIHLLLMSFQLSLTPLIYSHHQNPETPHKLAALFRYFVAASLLLSAGIALFSPELVQLLTRPDYYAAWTVIPLLVPSMLLSYMYMFAPGPALMKRTTIIAGINIGGAVSNFVLCVVMIPIWGIQGAALATCTSSGLTFLAYMIFSQRLYYAPHSWKPMLGATFLTSILVGFALQVEFSLLGGILLKLVLCFGIAGCIFLFGLVRAKEIWNFYVSVRQDYALRKQFKPNT